MGPSHALSGAAVWLAGSAVAEHWAGFHQPPVVVAVGAVVCAGGALLPDLDMSGRVMSNEGGATIAKTFGVVSLFAAECVEKLSLGVYELTRSRRDPDRDNGHRTLTHTLAFAAGVGAGTTWLCDRLGRWAVLGVLFVAAGLALRGLLPRWSARGGWPVTSAVAAGLALLAAPLLPAGRGYPLLGVALGVGCLVHLAGDAVTRAGVPALWPVPLGGRRWRMLGLPDPLAIRAGGPVETHVLRWLFVAVVVVAGLVLAFPALAADVAAALH